jgi:hypothetical protein
VRALKSWTGIIFHVVQIQKYDQNVAVLIREFLSLSPILKWWKILLGVVETRVTVMTGIRRTFRQCDDRPLLLRIRFVVNARLTSFVRIRIQNWKSVQLQMRKSRPGLTMLAKIIKTAVTPIAGRRKTRRLERISRRRSTESLSDLSGIIRFGSDNLMIVVRSIMRFHRFHSSLAAGPRDHTVGGKNVYPGISFPTAIPIKISILIF